MGHSAKYFGGLGLKNSRPLLDENCNLLPSRTSRSWQDGSVLAVSEALVEVVQLRCCWIFLGKVGGVKTAYERMQELEELNFMLINQEFFMVFTFYDCHWRDRF